MSLLLNNAASFRVKSGFMKTVMEKDLCKFSTDNEYVDELTVRPLAAM